MTGLRLPILLALSTILGAAPGASAATYCDYAVDSYNSAISDIERGLATYAQCLGRSQGEDDCSRSFRDLRTAHERFEDAVGDIRQNCES